MTEIDVPDWVVDEALFCTPVHDGDELAMPIDLMNFGSPEMLDRARSAMRAALAAALGAWVVPSHSVTNGIGPTTTIYTLRQEKPE